MKQEMCCQYDKTQPAISMHQGDYWFPINTQFWILIFQSWAAAEVVDPDLGVWKGWVCVADSSLMISLLLCVCSWVPRTCSYVNMWEQSRVFPLCFWNPNYSFKWLCWEQQRWARLSMNLPRVLCLLEATAIPCPRLLFINSCKASDPFSNSSNTDCGVTIN